MNKKDQILNAIKRIINDKYPLAKIYLYGSRVKGNSNENSDWDILVLIDEKKITPEIEEAITYPLYDLEFDTGEIISPMVYSVKEWNTKYKVSPFYNAVMKEGRRLQ